MYASNGYSQTSFSSTFYLPSFIGYEDVPLRVPRIYTLGDDPEHERHERPALHARAVESRRPHHTQIYNWTGRFRAIARLAAASLHPLHRRASLHTGRPSSSVPVASRDLAL